MMAWKTLTLGLLMFLPAATAIQYVGGTSVQHPQTGGRLGLGICQGDSEGGLPIPFGIGGVCRIDCTGSGTTCIVTNSNGADVYIVCWDTDNNGTEETCSTWQTGTHDTAGFKGPAIPSFLGKVHAFVLVGGTTGDISALDP